MCPYNCYYLYIDSRRNCIFYITVELYGIKYLYDILYRIRVQCYVALDFKFTINYFT